MNGAMMDEEQKEAIKGRLREFRGSYPLFAEKCLKIKTKAGGLAPFKFNSVQIKVDAALEKQKRETGKVRALIPKYRQGGISTYIEGRFYHRVCFTPGTKAFILTHSMDGTNNLYDMTRRFYDKSPAIVRPHVSKSNSKEMNFDLLGSEYRIGTAGSKDVGRSQTIQLFHGSEVAFWPNAVSHDSGILQAVPDLPGTEVIYESTGNGFDPVFYEKCQAAIKGDSDYIVIFLAWFEHEEYQTTVPSGFVLDGDEAEVMETYQLSLEQIAWRRKKIKDDFRGDVTEFTREYPGTMEEAFKPSGFESFIPSKSVEQAKKRNNAPTQILLIGVDPAETEDGDETAFAPRSGAHIFPLDTVRGQDPAQVAGLCVLLIKEHAPEFNPNSKYKKLVLFIDGIGIGAGVIAHLKENGYGGYVRRVDARHKAIREEDFYNKRSEMAGEFKEWLGDGGDLPDDPAVHQSCVALGYDYDSKGRKRLESKKDAKKRRGVSSPDRFDAICLTFAEPIHLEEFAPLETVSDGGWMS